MGVFIVGREGAVGFVGVGVGADAAVGEAEVVDDLAEGGGDAAGDAAAARAGEVLRAVVVVRLALVPVRLDEGLHGIVVAHGLTVCDPLPGGVGGGGGDGAGGFHLCGVEVEPHSGGRRDGGGVVGGVVDEGEHGRQLPVAADDDVALGGVEDVEQGSAAAVDGVLTAGGFDALGGEEGVGGGAGFVGRDGLCAGRQQRGGENQRQRQAGQQSVEMRFQHGITIWVRLKNGLQK